MDEITQNLGANADTRTPAQKQRDFLFNEIVSAPAPVAWKELLPTDWPRYPVRNQDGSSSCVAQSMAKIAGILRKQQHGEFVDYSAASIYNKRTNAGEGMIGVEAFDIARKLGLAPEVLLPSQGLSEPLLNAKVVGDKYTQDVALVSRTGEFVQYTAGDFDSVASTIAHTGKPVMVWFNFAMSEWTDVPTIGASNPINRHSVAAHTACLYSGKRGIVIDDSWGHFGLFDGQRFITEDFFRKRNLFAAYPINLKPASQQEHAAKPACPIIDLLFGARVEQVKVLQDFLKWDGTFPSNVESTGYYGAITARAVKAFVIKYGLTVVSSSDGRVWGAPERAQWGAL